MESSASTGDSLSPPAAPIDDCNYESFLDFLNGTKDADDIRKQCFDLSPLSHDGGENDDITYHGEEETVTDAPKLPQDEEEIDDDLVRETNFNDGKGLYVKEDTTTPLESKIHQQVVNNGEIDDETNEYYAGEMPKEEKTTSVSASTQSLLTKVCEKLDFNIAEIWLRIDASKHKLIHYHVSEVLDPSVRKQIIDVYQGEAAVKMKHRLSAAMCKWTKETENILKLTTQSSRGARALQNSLVSDVSVAVAVPFCHEDINMNILSFCINRASMEESQLEGCLVQKSEEIVKMAHEMEIVARKRSDDCQ